MAGLCPVAIATTAAAIVTSRPVARPTTATALGHVAVTRVASPSGLPVAAGSAGGGAVVRVTATTVARASVGGPRTGTPSTCGLSVWPSSRGPSTTPATTVAGSRPFTAFISTPTPDGTGPGTAGGGRASRTPIGNGGATRPTRAGGRDGHVTITSNTGLATATVRHGITLQGKRRGDKR